MASPGSSFRSLGFYAIAWIEHFLVHGPGDVQGQQIELDDEFAAFILKAYEVDSSGGRKVRRAFLSRSKGRSKSGLAAMIECFEALGECRFDHWAEPGEVSDWGYEFEPGEPVGRVLTYVEILNVATKESQAGNTYDAVYYMLNPDTCSVELLDRFGKLDVGLTRINLPESRGFIEPVTASNESKDGGKSTFIVADETHLWLPPMAGVFKLGKMHQTMVRNLLKRKIASGWMLETSTMYAEGENSVAEGTHSHAKHLEELGRNDGKLLFDHRQASEHWDLAKRPERIEALKEAYGPAAAWMDLEAIADYWDDPQASEAEFRRFWLNQPVPLAAPDIFDPVKWGSPPLLERDAPAPDRAVLTIAVSPDRRWACIGIAGDVGGKTLVLCHPIKGLSGVVGKVVELQESRDIAETIRLAGAAARALAPELSKAGVEFEVMPQTEMGAACGAFQQAYVDGTVIHVGQPELDVAVANAQTRMVGESEQWDRRDPKVDDSPLIACSAALYRWGLQEAPMPAIY
jgi:phage terminase large subunit-like protein